MLLLIFYAARAVLSCTRRLPRGRTCAVYAASDIGTCVGTGVLVFCIAPKLDLIGRVFLGFAGGIVAPTVIEAVVAVAAGMLGVTLTVIEAVVALAAGMLGG